MKNFISIILFTALLFSCNNSAVNNLVDSVTPEAEIVTVEVQPSTGEPDGPHTSVEWRVWAYSTAAPSFIAENCSVMAMDGTMLREGTNGWTAMAANPRGMSDPENGWKDPHEAMPMVGDGPAMQWAMAYMGGKHQKWIQMDGHGCYMEIWVKTILNTLFLTKKMLLKVNGSNLEHI